MRYNCLGVDGAKHQAELRSCNVTVHDVWCGLIAVAVADGVYEWCFGDSHALAWDHVCVSSLKRGFI